MLVKQPLRFTKLTTDPISPSLVLPSIKSVQKKYLSISTRFSAFASKISCFTPKSRLTYLYYSTWILQLTMIPPLKVIKKSYLHTTFSQVQTKVLRMFCNRKSRNIKRRRSSFFKEDETWRKRELCLKK